MISGLATYNRGYSLYFEDFGVRYCVYCPTLGVLQRSYSQYSQYLGLLSTRIILAASTPILLLLEVRSVLGTPSCTGTICETFIFP